MSKFKNMSLKTNLNYSSALSKLRGFATRFKDDNKGIAAIEFCLVAPVMLATYFGLVEVSLLIQADRSVTHASSLIGDLTSQGEELTPDMLEDYIYAALSVLDTDLKDSKEKVTMDLYSVEAFNTGNSAAPRGTRTIGHARYEPVTTVTTDPLTAPTSTTTVADSYDSDSISVNLLPTGTGIIVAQVNYEYSSPLQIFVKTVDLGETFFLKPRRSVTVPFGDEENDLDDMECSFSGTDDITCTAVERPDSSEEGTG